MMFYLLKYRESAVTEIAPACHQTNFGVLDLARTAFVAQLASRLDDVIGAPDVSLGEESAVSVERELATKLDTSAGDEILDLAPLAEAHCFDLEHHDVSEAVVNFEEVDVLVGNTGHRKGFRSRERRGRSQKDQDAPGCRRRDRDGPRRRRRYRPAAS